MKGPPISFTMEGVNLGGLKGEGVSSAKNLSVTTKGVHYRVLNLSSKRDTFASSVRGQQGWI